MELKVVLSTFAFMLFAELGDKTQLAALTASAGSGKPWSVFVGGSAALVVATLLAVLIGDGLRSLVRPHIIKGIAGVLFLIFGVWFIAGAFGAARAA